MFWNAACCNPPSVHWVALWTSDLTPPPLQNVHYPHEYKFLLKTCTFPKNPPVNILLQLLFLLKVSK